MFRGLGDVLGRAHHGVDNRKTVLSKLVGNRMLSASIPDFYRRIYLIVCSQERGCGTRIYIFGLFGLCPMFSIAVVAPWPGSIHHELI
jgi:hypothetical protein